VKKTEISSIKKPHNSKGPGKEPPSGSKTERMAGEPLEQLRELDPINADFGEEFFDRMHDQIMAKIEKMPGATKSKTPPARKKAVTLVESIRSQSL